MNDHYKSTRAFVLLSGGFDSVAMLHLALETHGPANVRAYSVDYSQPHRDQELTAAQTVTERLGVPWCRDLILGIGDLCTTPGYAIPGVSLAVVPGRNLLFLVKAANYAARIWPREAVELWLGSNEDDQAGFPDCRPDAIRGFEFALRGAFDGQTDFRVLAPWVERRWTKSQIARWAEGRDGLRELLALSVSCYRGTNCGTCGACEKRAPADAILGTSPGHYALSGGDPGREAR